MKQQLVGTYYCGCEQIDVYLRSGEGGEFYFTPENRHIPRIKIGADYKGWDRVVAVAMHEIVEFCLVRSGLRYEKSCEASMEHNGYYFSFNHNEYSEVIYRAAEMMSVLLPDLAVAWKSFRKPKKKLVTNKR